MSNFDTPTTEERLSRLREKYDEYAPAVISTVATIAGALLVRSYIRRNNVLTTIYKMDVVDRVEWREARKAWEKQLQPTQAS